MNERMDERSARMDSSLSVRKIQGWRGSALPKNHHDDIKPHISRAGLGPRASPASVPQGREASGQVSCLAEGGTWEGR